MPLRQFLGDSRTLWIAFVLSLAITAAFPAIAQALELAYLDAISDPQEARTLIASLSMEQRIAHAWVTATVDVAYPLAYGAFFIGSAYAFYGRFGGLIALPFFVLIPTDLIEGVVQVAALNGWVDWLDAKAILTPLKFLLFLFGVVTTVLGWVLFLVSRLRTTES